ncbi:MAG: hypothetical protein N2Z72_08785 [Bacteroidales bacterium]|nr:hypothetical protein [Bacteroidales bacterium]
MKKKKILFTLVLLMAVILFPVVINFIQLRLNSDIYPGEKDFAFLDTASVVKFFIADKKGNRVLLERKEGNIWMVNGKYEAHRDVIKEFLYTLFNMTVRNPVPLSMRDNVIRELASHGIKVEIYARVYGWNLLNMRWFPYIKRVRTFYVGHATKDQTGSFFLMEGYENPYVLHIPGFMGFINSRFSPFERDWRSHKVFEAQIHDIKEVEIKYPAFPENSFRIISHNGKFKLLNLNGIELLDSDTISIIAFLTQFVDVRFESLIDDASPDKLDSIRQLIPFCTIKLKTTQNQEQFIHLIKIKAPKGSTNIEGKPIEYDPEYLWGVLPSGEVVMTQYFVFGPLMKRLDDFRLKK